ncbi:hypothetical protein HYH03_012118 [Edaphochlamys debaryana]|uniref:Uncharacterized protein n=1 Tax=Edaphochlamys debaryana TaxID=47281 RepID=A0A835XQX1_9CHLO|nr:hypothetical protein HYH03_012118 [Edaphochlamys debaryana]|eukprot:KAG2489482.1 hypothetical protein HYH03_012118 [Edaphochlamys debaryana]
MANDEVLARQLQKQLDAEHAGISQGKGRLEESDRDYARRVQEEVNLEAAFDAATAVVNAKEGINLPYAPNPPPQPLRKLCQTQPVGPAPVKK